LLQPRIFNLVASAKGLIKEIRAALPYTKGMPILYDTEDIDKIKIKSWDDLGFSKSGEWKK
jgi:hypothetical protein